MSVTDSSQAAGYGFQRSMNGHLERAGPGAQRASHRERPENRGRQCRAEWVTGRHTVRDIRITADGTPAKISYIVNLLKIYYKKHIS